MDLAPCSHTKNLKQSQGVVLADKCKDKIALHSILSHVNLIYIALAHCSQCALTNNLWLCLICGALGCGRQQVDGSGGHGHALAHYQSTGHSVAVKTGTITPEGSACMLIFSNTNLTHFIKQSTATAVMKTYLTQTSLITCVISGWILTRWKKRNKLW